jgi:hypothetical protein
MLVLPFTLILFTYYSSVNAGSVNKFGTCNQANNRLQTGTYQFDSDCDSVTYCASNSTCLLRGCRRDIFPFGYPQDSDSLPPLCKAGSFCPDEMDGCQPVLPVGSPCQLNRDDQCQAPSNYAELADTSNMGLNYNGSVCINNVCMWANVTAGSACVVENIGYVAYGPSGEEFIDIVSRGNCRVGLYCDSQQKVCMAQKQLNAACDADKECASFNCLSTGVCGKSAAAPNHFGAWIYILVGFGIFGGMFGTLSGLFLFHRRQREREREKRVQYWREQNTFLENIRQMRETAQASILSLPSQGQHGEDPTLRAAFGREHSDDGHHAPKSGLRRQDTSIEANQSLSHTRFRPDGRF